MFNFMLLWLVSRGWNYLQRLQQPVDYIKRETPNFYIAHDILNDEVKLVFHVEQIEMLRVPRSPFYRKRIYMYRVNLHYVKGSKIEITRNFILPEYCSFIYRSTKVPHILAINAVKALEPGIGKV